MKASKRNAEDKDTQAGDEGAEGPSRKMSKVIIANKAILFFNCKYKAKIMFIVVMDKDL